MQQTNVPTNEAAIVGRLIKPDRGDFSPEAARELLSLQFDSEDQTRIANFPSRLRMELSRPLSKPRLRTIGGWDIGLAFSGRKRDSP